jgi:hypothetical protein
VVEIGSVGDEFTHEQHVTFMSGKHQGCLAVPVQRVDIDAGRQ